MTLEGAFGELKFARKRAQTVAHSHGFSDELAVGGDDLGGFGEKPSGGDCQESAEGPGTVKSGEFGSHEGYV